MKVSFDLNSVKSFCIQHAEKFVFAGVILGLVFFAYGATRIPKVPFAPEELSTAAENAKKHWESTPVGPFLDEKGLRAPPYTDIARQIRDPIKPDWYEPQDKPLLFDGGIWEDRGKRDEPQLYPVQELRATAGHGLLGGRVGMTSRSATINIPAGWRWVVLTGLIPIADQLKAYEDAFSDARSQRPELDLPIYVSYLVQRAELSSTGQGGQLEWKPLDLRRSWVVTTLYRGSPPQLIHPMYLPQQPSGTVPLVYPLAPLANAQWANEVAHPPQVPLAIDMPEPERPPTAYPPGFEALMPPPGESEEGEAEQGEDQFRSFPGFGAFRGTDEDEYEEEYEEDGYGRSYPGSSPFGRLPFGGPGGNFPPMNIPGLPGAGYPGSPGPPGTAPYPGQPGRPGMPTMPVEQEIEYHLFRFFDYWVEPGKRYQYKVQLVLYNPNFRVPVHLLVQETPDERQWAMTDWSDPSNSIYVPRDSRLLAGPVKPGRMATEPEANVVAVTFRTQDGLEAGGEFTVARGQLANLEGTAAELPGTGRSRTYGGPSEYDEEYEEEYDEEYDEDTGPYRRPGQQQESEGEPIVHETGMVVLDIDGGNRLHRTDQTLTEPGSLLLLDPDGNLIVLHELSDMDEFSLYHVPEEKKRPPRDERDRMYEEDGYSDYYELDEEEDEGYGRGRGRRRPTRRSRDEEYE